MGTYDHWKSDQMQTDLKPFRFYLTELIACYQCKSMFQSLQVHTETLIRAGQNVRKKKYFWFD